MTSSGNGRFPRSLMFPFHSFKREEFLRHYHKRSNVESTLSVVKAKSRDRLRSKAATAMVNAVPCKLLAHDLCGVIQSQCALGIEATLWPDERAAEGPDVLPRVRPG